MKKLLLGIISILIIVLTVITIMNGLEIGGFKILGITEINEENEKLDQKILQATKLASTDYQKKLDGLEEANKKLETEKNKYDEMVTVSTDSEVEAANQSYDYDYDFLWVRIGNHAKSEGVTMKLVIKTNSSGGENMYDLDITANGTYVGIEEFITNIEDDNRLGFKIENFQMAPTSEENVLEATFSCKNIKINGLSTNVENNNNNNNSNNDNNTSTTEIEDKVDDEQEKQ